MAPRQRPIATYDAEFRARFDRKITSWATDFMRRSHRDGKPFYPYLPYTQMDDFTGQILDEPDRLGLADDTIVVWASDNDSTYRFRPTVRPENRAAINDEMARLDGTVIAAFGDKVDHDRAHASDPQGIGGPEERRRSA